MPKPHQIKPSKRLDPKLHAVMLNWVTVCQLMGLSKSTLWRQINNGLFPRPIIYSRNLSVLPSDEVYQVRAARLAGCSEDQIKNLVAELAVKRVEGSDYLSEADQATVGKYAANHIRVLTKDRFVKNQEALEN